jgi:tRNA dimethylallyltransferase
LAASPLLCVMGPTAAGKTDLAVSLAESLNGELISVDSALVYRDLNIGTAKPDFPHHLIDLRAPSDPYSAMQFARDATTVIAEVRARGRLPILVGGTMLYFRALLEGLDDMPASDPVVRQKIEADAAAEGCTLGFSLLTPF